MTKRLAGAPGKSFLKDKYKRKGLFILLTAGKRALPAVLLKPVG